MSSLLIGLIGGTLCFSAIVFLKAKFGYDDTLDVFGCHGVAGIWGTIATGIFSTKSVNPAGADGLLYGNFELFKVQLIGVGACIVYAAVVTFIILKVISIFVKLRTTGEEESTGLDIALHGEKAYNIF
jgi:Amt family ammonium transporter